MSDSFGTSLAKLITTTLTRSVVYETFADTTVSASIRATTRTGSVYEISFEPGAVNSVDYHDADVVAAYTCRSATVTINGEVIDGDGLYAGFDFHTGTILVINGPTNKMIRRSSSIATFEQTR